jgi:LmbE family N-acetylglucosaminyl deacetylase
MKVLAYEVPSATDWAFRRFGPGIRPNVFVDIHETLSMKLRAMEMYESEARPFPHPRSMQALEANARRWGSVVGVAAAEAFELVRSLE